MNLCRFYERGYCKYGNKCKFSHLSYCRNYKQGFCKSGIKCRFEHIANLLILPLDMLKIIFEQVYLSDLLPVSKLLNTIINSNFSLQLFVFTGIMNGGYTNGCAVSTARNLNDAIFMIAAGNGGTKQLSSDCGTWRYDNHIKCDYLFPISDRHCRERLKRDTSALGAFFNKILRNSDLTTLSRRELIATQQQMLAVYNELMTVKPAILPLNISIGFYNGGGD